MADNEILTRLETLTLEAMADLEGAKDENALQQWRETHLGKESELKQLHEKLAESSAEEHQKLEEAHAKLEAAYEARAVELHKLNPNTDLRARLQAFTLEALSEIEGASDEDTLKKLHEERLAQLHAKLESSKEDREKLEEAAKEAHAKLDAAYEARAVALHKLNPNTDLRARLQAFTLEALSEIEGASDEDTLKKLHEERLAQLHAKLESSKEDREKLEEAAKEAHAKLDAAYEARAVALHKLNPNTDLRARLQAFTLETLAEIEGAADEDTLKNVRESRRSQFHAKLEALSKEDREKLEAAAKEAHAKLDAAFEARAAKLHHGK